MAFEQSEVAHLRWRLAQEESAARLGLTGAAVTARHEMINARAQRGAARILRLIEQGRHAEAQALMDLPDWGVANEQEPEDRSPLTIGEQETDSLRIWQPGQTDQSHLITPREHTPFPLPESRSQENVGACAWGTPHEQGEQQDLVLIVDDSPTMRAILRVNLSRAGYVCRDFADGASTLDWLRRDISCAPCLLLLDLDLPDMNGYEIARAIYADPRWQTLAIVILTGYDQGIERRQRRLPGARAYLTKPFRVDQLLAVVRETLHTPHPVFSATEQDGETSTR